MTKYEIIDGLARERRVEQLVENIAHQALDQLLKDLCQMVYLVLLEYDEDKIIDLWENGEINFFIVRIIINQYRSTNSPFHKLFRKYQLRSFSIPPNWDITETEIAKIKRELIIVEE